MAVERRSPIPEILKFACVGGLSTLLDVAVFWLLIGAGLPPVAAHVVSYTAVAALNFLLNGTWTYAHRELRGRLFAPSRLAAFAIAKCVTLFVSTITLAAALVMLSPLAAKVVSLGLTFGVAVVLSRRFVFAERGTSPRVS